MKPHWAKQEVYDYFDSFLEQSILSNNSFITEGSGIFSIENLNNCVSAFVDNPDTSARNFDEKSKDQFANASKETKEVFAHFIWLWGLSTSDMRSWGKQSAVIRFLGEEYNDLLSDVFVDGGIGSAGQRHKLNKPFEISYLLLLFRDVKINLLSNEINDIQSLKEYIESLCKELYYKNDDTELTTDKRLKKVSKEFLALHHIILHLCNPQKYEAIAAQKHKDAIINTFFSLLDKENTDGLWGDIDGSILLIREELKDYVGNEFSFYDKKIQDAWNFGEDKNDFVSIETLFEYKKAMIFYGPPGTSKTYSATRLAELIITKQYFRNKHNIKEYFENSDQIFEKQIHHLQLHSNYNYEDFIVGLHIEESKSIAKPGYLLNLIDKVREDDLPHILILDEINRTDISRLFGELFSALEYRNKKIKLSVGNFEIALPDNLYFIGTMNEIDFSLERVDFALRRRFLWQFKGFDRNILWQIINEKRNSLKIGINSTEIETFINKCEQLNNEISKIPELGENYQIGHTFFAEIVDIFNSFKNIHSGRRYFLNQPVNILWEVSIKPILQAFLGNMDADSKNQKINQLQKVFIND
ncbi:5-methylcytosine-specific restriction enzyme B [Sinomicrobium oceani]|uniref:5-methylcytosine-specific restriction enzyme B n=1 Tax=Sinomicrobium oceani TaxID=1150368 RepID=A0A1K1RRC3_9FLAO|nr:AAA family ATPase [Sinomicrobium oceani]SFW74434.1 5-methylcytosine-specific restriction enzyme B [Sinomicrobium oceani]